MAQSRLDFVVFGATGFTGKYVVQEIINVAKTKGPLSWGVAGRSQARLEKLLSDLSETNKQDFKETPIIIADAKDEDSLNAMAAKARVVLNCCGPFRFFGEPVVKACVNNEAHHVDVSGEPQYMEQMQLKYHEQAAERGVYIISACGFDSIPTDLGIIFLEKEFKGQVNAVETYLESSVVGDVDKSGALIHYTTWESAVHGLANAKELGPLRRQLYPERLPPLQPKLPARSLLHKNEVLKKWALPFPGSDRAVVQRSQRFLLELEKKRPVQVYTYVAFSSLLTAFMVSLVGMVFGFLSMFGLGRKLLLEYPKLFSFGAVSHEGPTEELAAATHFSVTIIGQGWSEKQAEPLDNPQSPPDKTLVVRVSGVNPGYGATATTLVLAALTVLRESSAMPGRGGVFPPGAAFARTSMLAELPASGLRFDLLQGGEAGNVREKVQHSYLGAWTHGLITSGIY